MLEHTSSPFIAAQPAPALLPAHIASPRGPAVVLRSVYKSYRGGHRGGPRRTEVLRGVHLDVRAGETVGIAADGGAGKTTLLLCAAGLTRPDDGLVSWPGGPTGGRVPAWAAFVPHRPVYASWLTVRETLEQYVAGHAATIVPGSRTIPEALERFALADHARERVNGLPAETLRRLGLAQAALGRPKLLLLDEALTGLGARMLDCAADLMAQLRGEGVAVILTGADSGVLAASCTRLLILRDGVLRPQRGV